MKALRLFIPIFIAALALGHVGAARASGGTYHFDGGSAYERSQVRQALAVSRFNWSIVPADITIHIARAVDTHSVKGNIYLDAGLLDAGQFSWGTVQDEFSHQVDFFLFTPSIRAQLQSALGAKAWCYENPAFQAHADQGCERFTSMVPWAYWQSKNNAYRPASKTDESASMQPAKFRALLDRLLGPSITDR